MENKGICGSHAQCTFKKTLPVAYFTSSVFTIDVPAILVGSIHL